MKKVLLVVALCVAIVAANAQDTKTAPKAKAEQVTSKAGKNIIKEADLMKPIKDDYVKQVPGAKFEKAMKMENAKTGVTYEVVVKKEKVSWTLVYDKDGKFLKKEEIKAVEKKVETKKAATPEAK